MNADDLLRQLQPFLKKQMSAAEREQLQTLLRTSRQTQYTTQLQDIVSAEEAAARATITAFADWLETYAHAEPAEAEKAWAEQSFRSQLSLPVNAACLLIADRSGAQLKSGADDGDSADDRDMGGTLRPLLTSYFGGDEHLLIPLHGADVLLILPLTADVRAGQHSTRTKLTQSALGLQAMLENEWRGGVCMSVVEPLRAESLQTAHAHYPSALNELRRTMRTGIALQARERVFFSWQLELENWLAQLPTDALLKLVATTFPAIEQLDRETLDMLQRFFANNCNLGMTARALHMHRNTLVYRFEKLQAETGRDVRQFADAQWIRLALLASRLAR